MKRGSWSHWRRRCLVRAIPPKSWPTYKKRWANSAPRLLRRSSARKCLNWSSAWSIRQDNDHGIVMSDITYIKGDATCPRAKGVKLICHICNDLGGWGKGFVLAISNRWKEPDQQYRVWHAERGHNGF